MFNSTLIGQIVEILDWRESSVRLLHGIYMVFFLNMTLLVQEFRCKWFEATTTCQNQRLTENLVARRLCSKNLHFQNQRMLQ